MNDVMFFHYWIAFSILVLIAAGIAIAWANLKGLFRDQDRARHLALWAEVPEDGKVPAGLPAPGSSQAQKKGGSGDN